MEVTVIAWALIRNTVARIRIRKENPVDYSALRNACHRAQTADDARKAQESEWWEQKIQSHVDAIVEGIKSNAVFRGPMAEVPLHLATKRECQHVADRLNVLFPGSEWRRFTGHNLCAWYQGRGCDCGGAYFGVCCELSKLTAAIERMA